jgi:hypothetical protein
MTTPIILPTYEKEEIRERVEKANYSEKLTCQITDFLIWFKESGFRIRGRK